MSALTAAATISYSEFLEKQPGLPSSYHDLLPGWHAPEWSRVAYILYVSSTIVREIPVLCRLVSSVSFSEDASLILCKLMQCLPWGATNFFVKTKSVDPQVLLQDFNQLSVTICHTVTRKSSIPNHGRQGYKRMIRTMVGDGRDRLVEGPKVCDLASEASFSACNSCMSFSAFWTCSCNTSHEISMGACVWVGVRDKGLALVTQNPFFQRGSGTHRNYYHLAHSFRPFIFHFRCDEIKKKHEPISGLNPNPLHALHLCVRAFNCLSRQISQQRSDFFLP